VATLKKPTLCQARQLLRSDCWAGTGTASQSCPRPARHEIRWQVRRRVGGLHMSLPAKKRCGASLVRTRRRWCGCARSRRDATSRGSDDEY